MDSITKQNGNELGKRQVEGQTIIIRKECNNTNWLGAVGFILSLLSLIFFLFVSVNLAWVLWTLGMFFSFMGIFRTPRGLAIAGLVISCIALIVGIIFKIVIVSFIIDFLDLLL